MALQPWTWSPPLFGGGNDEGVIAAFEQLNPYDHDVVAGSILELEDENYDPNTSVQRTASGRKL